MATRQEQKAQSRKRILTVASRRLREGGPAKVGVSAVMAEVGLTHGAFYAHFKNKDELLGAAFEFALETNQRAWFAGAVDAADFKGRLKLLSESYLSLYHKDHPGTGCAIAALASELVDAPDVLKENYASAIERTARLIAEGKEDQLSESLNFLSLMTGAINLARNAPDETLSERILESAKARFA